MAASETSEQKTGTGLARKGIWAVADQGVLSAGNFLTGWLLARLADRDEYGSWAVIYVAILSFNAVQSALVSIPMMVVGSSFEQGRFRRYVTSMGFAQIWLVLGLSVLSLLLGPVVSHFAGAKVLVPWTAMSLALIFLHSQEFCRRVLYCKLRLPRVFALDLLVTSLQLVGLVALWWLGGGQWGVEGKAGALSATNALLVMAAAAAIGTTFGWLQIREHYEFPHGRVREYLAESWRIGRPGLGGLMGETLHFQGSLTVLSLTIGAAGTALAEIPRLLLAPLHILHFAGVNVVTPRASQLLAQSGPSALRRHLPKLAVLWMIPFVAYPLVIVAAPEFWLKLLYGGKWDQAANLVRLAAISQGIIGLRVFPWIVVTAMRRNDLYMRGSLTTGLLSLLLTIVLVGKYQSAAAFWGRLVADSVMLIAGVLVLMHLLRTPEVNTPPVGAAAEGA